jgi:hypothetical protein
VKLKSQSNEITVSIDTKEKPDEHNLRNLERRSEPYLSSSTKEPNKLNSKKAVQEESTQSNAKQFVTHEPNNSVNLDSIKKNKDENKMFKETSKNNVKLKFQSSQEAVGVNVQKELNERNLQNMRKSNEPHSSSSRKKNQIYKSSEKAAQNKPLQVNTKIPK